MALAWNVENGTVLCKSLAGIIVGGDGQIGGGAGIVVIWGFLEVFTRGLYTVVGTSSHYGGDGGVSAEQGKWEWVCVHDEDTWRSEGFSPHPHILLLPPPQRWRRRALALRRWCPAHPRPLHLLGSTSRASCAMTSPPATTTGSALVKAARCVRGGTLRVDALGGHITW